jgi:diacylglycerol kinase (ATP)
MRRAALLYNPRAGQHPRARGGRRSARRLERIAAELRRGFELEVTPTRGPDHCRELARDAVAREFAAVFALGGDGTQRVLAGILAGTGVALGPLPGGTTNVVAGALGLPADPVAAARALAAGSVREMDVGRCGEGAFLMQVSGGLDAAVMARVDPRLKQRLGKLAVLWAGFREWRRYGFPFFRLEADGAVVEATGFVVVNLARYAGSFEIVPGARADDRQLELLLFTGRRRRAALGFALDLLRGRHLGRPDVSVRRVARVRVLAPDPLQLQGDGDAFGVRPPLDLSLSARRLKILAPGPAPG